MPELPDVTIYVEKLRERVAGATLRRADIIGPFLLRTFEPTVDAAVGRTIERVSRMGKRIVLSMSGDLHLVFHLMIAGRFRWLAPRARPPAKISLAAFTFDAGTLALTEAGTKRRASLHVIAGADALRRLDPGGLEPLDCDADAFGAALRRENHTLKRSLTDPRLFSGIGHAYSDEILHAARLSPVKLTSRLTDAEIARLHSATVATLERWIDELRAEFHDRFPGPGDITAFRPDFAVHGRYSQPCPVCGTPVQRIRYAENETNYCPKCQTDGKVLADRSLSRLLREDWPRTVEELEDFSFRTPS